MYLKTLAVFSVAFALILTTGLVRGVVNHQPVDYLAREALPEDLPEIPGPPRSAKRTLYDTLRGADRSAKQTSPASPERAKQADSRPRTRSGKELPLLPVRSAPAAASSKSNAPAPGSLERVREPVPAARPSAVKSSPASASDTPSPSGGSKRAVPPREASRKATPVLQAKRNPGPVAVPAPERQPESKSEQNVRSGNNGSELKQRSVKAAATKSTAAKTKKTSKSGGRIIPGSRRTIGKHDPKIEPTPRGEFRYYAPHYYRGIYLNNGVVRSKKRYERLFEQSRKHKINTLVADVQPRFPSKEFIRAAREAGFYLVARVVVFEGGLKQPTVPEKHLNKVLDAAEQAARSGFMEIQLDYIRFADRARIGNLNFKQRYKVIAGILKMATDRLRPLGVRVGADIFGRIPFNQNDRIGQRMEVFAAHLDTLYPMLYPSHFYGDPSYIKDPYRTIYQGQKKSIERVGDTTRSIAYIQGFKMKVGPSGLSYHDYIRRQLDASLDSGGAGFVVWNARSAYGPFFKALADHDRRQARRAAKP